MSLIDSSYFIGSINIPNTSKPEISERLDWFIKKYEPVLLAGVLGYELYQAFKTGLQQTVVDQKWFDILYGSDFTYNNRLRRFRGLIVIDDELNPGTYFPEDINFTADQDNEDTGEYHNSFLTGKTYRVVQRGVGPLVPVDEIVFLSDGFSKVAGFQVGEKFTIQFTQATPLPEPAGVTTSDIKQSLIANYVYFYWMKDQYTQTVGLGEVASKAENAELANPAAKMILAWNEMIDDIDNLYLFLQQNQSVYPEWNTGQNKRSFRHQFQHINQWGI